MFENPAALLLLLLLPVMAALFYWRDRTRKVLILRIGNPKLVHNLAGQVSQPLRRWKSALWLATLTAVIVALADPVWGVEADVIEARGVAIVIALDVSASMAAQDLQPNRLERARLAIRDLLDFGVGNLYGMVTFAGDAFVQFPLTSDADTAAVFVNAAGIESVARQGTAIDDALRLAISVFDERITDEAIIVLLTDGENHEGEPLATAQVAAEQGITIHAIGYGSPEGDILPVYDTNGAISEYKTDRAGQIVLSQLDEGLLQDIADATGGLYQRASDSGVEVVNLLNRIAEVESEVLETRLQTRGVPRFALFIALALITLTVEMALPETRRPKAENI